MNRISDHLGHLLILLHFWFLNQGNGLEIQCLTSGLPLFVLESMACKN
jgi:hypothetical protein